jgi:DNA-binding response OmpR family regulator
VRAAPARPPRSVLLVEDDDAVRRSLQLVLTGRGHRVRAYASAVGLAQDPAALACDCLIADLMMPPTDAVALLGDLRSVGWSGCAVLISGLLDDAWREKVLAVGYDAILTKPLSETLLARTVEHLPR